MHTPLTGASSVTADDEEFRSYFADATKECEAFRILLIGKTGSGKSTLVTEVFDFELEAQDCQVNDYEVGEHDINHPILSSNNQSLILHDSKGLEAGSDANLKLVTNFIHDRKGRPFAEQLHAIWYCVEIPISGERVLEGGDIALLESLLSMKNTVPLIVVFTKLDRLHLHEQLRLKKAYVKGGMDSKAATAKAKAECVATSEIRFTTSCVEVLQSQRIPRAWSNYCAVSNKQPQTIVKLVELTKSMLTDSETLNILWAQAQMIDVDLKVSLSLRAGKNLYRLGIFTSMVPMKTVRKISMLKVLSGIHSDVVHIWNLNDPEEILIGANMRTMVRQLFIDPAISPALDGSPGPDNNSSRIIETIVGAALNPITMVGPVVTGALGYLDDIVETTPAAARVLMAYIADLTLGMESLHWVIRQKKDKVVTDEDIIKAFTRYRISENRNQVHKKIRDFIGDENISRPFKREKVLERVKDIVAKCRLNPKEMFKDRQAK